MALNRKTGLMSRAIPQWDERPCPRVARNFFHMSIQFTSVAIEGAEWLADLRARSPTRWCAITGEARPPLVIAHHAPAVSGLLAMADAKVLAFMGESLDTALGFCHL